MQLYNMRLGTKPISEPNNEVSDNKSLVTLNQLQGLNDNYNEIKKEIDELQKLIEMLANMNLRINNNMIGNLCFYGSVVK